MKQFVSLSEEERALLVQQCKAGSWTPRQIIRAKILLLADVNGSDCLTDEQIAKQLGCSKATVANRRRLFVQTRSVETTIFDKPRSGRPTLVEGAVDAHMTAIACSSPPEGHSQWTLRLIKDRLVALEIVDDISHMTVSRALKKKKSNRG